jgi:hypothetical protein
MVNSAFGKFLESVRNRERVVLVNTPEALNKVTSKSTFVRVKILNNNLVAVHLRRVVTTLDKPIQVGVRILDTAKVTLYSFHYDYIRVRYGDRAQLCYTDTDSLVYHVRTKDVYEDMGENRHLFDLSTYPRSHFLHDLTNRKKLGLWSDEARGKMILEFCGLKSKLYSLRFADATEQRAAKGVQRSCIQKDLCHEMYMSCLRDKTLVRCAFQQIRAQKHIVYTTSQTKVAMNSFSDKRYILADGIARRNCLL